MSRFDDLWSKGAIDALHALSPAQQEQAEALVRAICADPQGATSGPVAGLPRLRMAEAGDLTVFFQIDELDSLIYVIRVAVRG